MSNVLVLYATREGHTRRIAEHVAATLRAQGARAEVRNVTDPDPMANLSQFDRIVLAASVHKGSHEPEMIALAKRHRSELDRIPTAFLSVSLTEAGAEDASQPDAKRAQAAAEVQGFMDRFYQDTGWRPRESMPVAGALLYTQYNRLLRFVMKTISKRSGGDTDTSRDYVYTDWEALDRFVAHLIE